MLVQTTIDLNAISADSLLEAIEEFDRIGRRGFLEKYDFSRSSKFYLIHEQRLYDTKALVGAAHFHASGRTLGHDEFYGGTQTTTVIQRIIETDGRFEASKVFNDEFGNLADDFGRLPDTMSDIRALGFSKWIPLDRYNQLNTGRLPGVYVISDCVDPPAKMSVIDPSVVYIGLTVDQYLRMRLFQFSSALNGSEGHSGGSRLLGLGMPRHKLWLSIRSFPLVCAREVEGPRLRSSQIQYLEQHLLYEYVRSNRAYPAGNLK